ncbi:hypothetical protein FOA52_001013 [Chlamydomonas sp. UWO 241]|nr:hypothetical protein FOA52_001013 [Chlamydomonas sp. UWO 241]
MGHVDAAFMDALVQAASSQLYKFNAQDLAKMAWALATVGHVDAAFMGALAQAASSQLRSFKPQELANTAWALATVGHVDAAFTGGFVPAAQLHPQDVANTAWALAQLGHVDAVFMGALVQAALSQLRSFQPQDLANTAWALATMGHSDADFMGALVQAATLQLLNFNPQNLANTAWALAALDEQHAGFMGALIEQACTMDLNALGLCQLFQSMLWLDTWQQAAPAVPPQLFTACKKAWLEEVGITRVSCAQPQVLDAIRQLPGCSDASSEHQTDDGLFSIDIALPGGNKKLAVEADGPTHFLSNTPAVPTGATRLRNRLLEARGWRVVSVPVTERDRQVAKGAQAANAYLSSLDVRV